ncbi:neuronal acetylcholine receptor subunit alpha-7-like [Aulostomus maculatus]
MSQWMHVFLLKWCARFLCMKPPGAAMGPSGPQSNNSNLTCVGMQSLESPPFAPGTATSDSGVLGGQLDGRPQEDDSLISKAQSPPADPELAKILEQVRYIAKRFSDQQEVETVSNEWKFAASVIDRLCLVAFTLVTFQCTLGILLSAPNFA